MGYTEGSTGSFSARRRHLMALEKAERFLLDGQQQIYSGAGELLAEDLRQCQNSLGEITGAVSSDDLLGAIFSSFCIGYHENLGGLGFVVELGPVEFFAVPLPLPNLLVS